MLILRFLLLPVSLLYGFIIQIRNLFYNAGIFKGHKFDIPIISVGNISAGGTGKTPFTIYMAEKLMGQGLKVAVISRGYGRKIKGFFLVSDGLNFQGKTKIHGDEPVLISLRLPEAIVAVDENRASAIKEILDRKLKVDVILLDDAFQHRSVKRSLDIVLLKNEENLLNKWVLPSGLLREFKFNLVRAGILVNTDGIMKDTSIPNRFFCRFQNRICVDIDFAESGFLRDFSGQKCIAFAGIANPKNFQIHLEKSGISVEKFLPYKDHYIYTEKDAKYFTEICKEHGCNVLFCTEKDLVKISEFGKQKYIFAKSGIKIFAPRLDTIVVNEALFWQEVSSYFNK